MSNSEIAKSKISVSMEIIKNKRHYWLLRMLQILPIIESDEHQTAATDGTAIYYNPDYFASLDTAHVTGILVHEVLHVIQRHSLRIGKRDHRRFNIAADHAINGIVESLFYVLPEGALIPIPGSAEKLYGSLPSTQQQPEKGKGNPKGDPSSDDTGDSTQPESGDSDQNDPNQGDSGESGDSKADGESSDSGDGQSDSVDGNPGDGSSDGGQDVIPYPLQEGETIADAERAIDRMIAQAQIACRNAGQGPGDGEAAAFAPVDSDLNWPSELEDLVIHTGTSDYSMNPPHIGLMEQGIICNQLNPSGCGHVVLGVDVSGSINESKLNLAVTNLILFVENMDYESLRVIACSSYVKYDREFMRGEPIDLSDMPIGGGTAFQPVFDNIAESGIVPDLFIYFTDMETLDMEDSEDPGYPVVWLVDNEGAITESGEWAEDYHQPRFTPSYGRIIDANK